MKVKYSNYLRKERENYLMEIALTKRTKKARNIKINPQKTNTKTLVA
jgi:hypothetical protein